jgi:hypothetical protein
MSNPYHGVLKYGPGGKLSIYFHQIVPTPVSVQQGGRAFRIEYYAAFEMV